MSPNNHDVKKYLICKINNFCNRAEDGSIIDLQMIKELSKKSLSELEEMVKRITIK